MSASIIKTGMDELTGEIRAQRLVLAKASQNAAGAVEALNAIPTKYADVIGLVNALPGENAFEQNAKAELAALTEEFLELVSTGTEIANRSL